MTGKQQEPRASEPAAPPEAYVTLPGLAPHTLAGVNSLVRGSMLDPKPTLAKKRAFRYFPPHRVEICSFLGRSL